MVHIWVRVVDPCRSISISPSCGACVERSIGHNVRANELVAAKVVGLEIAGTRRQLS